MTDRNAMWETGRKPVKWPVDRDRLTEFSYPIWGLTGVALALLLGGVLGRGFPGTQDPVMERMRGDLATLTSELHELRSALELRDLELERFQTIHRYSTDYRIPSDLATLIYDIALAEGLEPDLGYRLVKVESGFRRTAVSSKGAIGYAQIMPSTGRWLDPTIETRDLFDPEINLHLGFRYLRYLLDEYDGDMRLALLAYNRGPGRVQGLLSMGIDPGNGYARAVLGE